MPTQLTKAPAASPATGKRFFEAVLAANPFAMNRVDDPSRMECDVETIHADAFQRLVDGANEAYQAPQGIGALLWGNAGTGKSHLLARLSRWAAKRGACFVYLRNIQVGADDISRYLLKACITQLAEDRLDRLHETPLFTIANAALRAAAKEEKFTKGNVPGRDEACRRLARRLQGDERVFDVVFRFVDAVWKTARGTSQSRQQNAELAALAVRWLKGDVLDKGDALRIGQKIAKPGGEVVQAGEDVVGSVLADICRLAGKSGRLFVLCVDQIDTMRDDQLTALGHTLHLLVENAPNLFVVAAGVWDYLAQKIEGGVITEADADRLNYKQPVIVSRVKRDQARQLLRERLLNFLDRASPADCKPFFRDDALFPLGEAWFEGKLGAELEMRPRDVLSCAAERWRQIQKRIRDEGGEAWLKSWLGIDPPPPPLPLEEMIDEKVNAKLVEAVNKRRLQPGQLPADGNDLRNLTHQLLSHCLDQSQKYSLRRLEIPRGSKIDLVLCTADGAHDVRSHLQFLVTGSKASATVQLKKLRNRAAVDRRILVTDSREPLPLSPAGREHLEALQALGASAFTHVALEFEQYAELDALASVIGEARSGDLEIRVEPGRPVPVTERQVVESYHRQGRYQNHVLLGMLLAGKPPIVIPPPPPPFEPEFRQFVLAKLSFLMGANMIELTRGFVATHPGMNLEGCLPLVREIVLRMHQEDLVCAKPWEDDICLTIGPKA